MSRSNRFSVLLEKFFMQRLINQKHASKETITAYRDTWRLLLRFANSELGKNPSNLSLEDLDADLICRFLNYLEEQRKNGARTRNHRLTAIRSFFRYVAFEEPMLANHIQRVLAIPSKRWTKPSIDFLTLKEVDTILEGIDISSWNGRRDHALLSLAVHSGLRVSELISLRCGDVSLGSGAYVKCQGKGRKNRSIPLGKSMARIINQWQCVCGSSPADPLFPNRFGNELSRDGVEYILKKHVLTATNKCPSLRKKRVSPHVLRHTTAVHLLQAGADLSVIALWLGHESVESTQTYIDSDLNYKRSILAKTVQVHAKNIIFKPDDKLMAFLRNL